MRERAFEQQKPRENYGKAADLLLCSREKECKGASNIDSIQAGNVALSK